MNSISEVNLLDKKLDYFYGPYNKSKVDDQKHMTFEEEKVKHYINALGS